MVQGYHAVHELLKKFRLTPIRRYMAVVLVTALMTGGLLLFEPPLDNATIALGYLLGVLAIATTTGLGPAILTSVLCFLAFNFFFVSPRYTFHVDTAQDILRLVTFLAVAVIASSLSARARKAAEQAKSQAAELVALYQLSQTISAQVDLDRILPVIAETTCQLLRIPACAVLLYNEGGRLIERARAGLTDTRLQAIQIPIRDGSAVLGILRVFERAPSGGLRADELQLLDTLAAQTRLAVERARLVAQVAHTQALSESEQLKSALLASVTHDIRTPLAIIKAATSTLLDADVAWDAQTQHALTQTIDAEVDHLNRQVGNLLDMSRIEAGTLSSERDWHDLAEVIGATLQRLEPQSNGRTIAVELAPDLPLVSINAVLIDQVLTNLLENALKYTTPGTSIVLTVRCIDDPADSGRVVVTVRDYGPGIPTDDLSHIFEKFYRGPAAIGPAGGAGLGLAICRGIIEAHGGHIWAENCPDGGMAFWFTLPRAASAMAIADSERHNQTAE
jgi:two-component system sensor histidine kinase KdpD